MKIQKLDKIWIDGGLIDWDDATEHVLCHTLHYGLGVFEGIRAYKRGNGKTAIFRLQEHIDRLFESALICTIDIPYTRKEVIDACIEVLRANKMDSAYLRPIAYLGSGVLGLGSLDAPIRTAVVAFEWGAYLGEKGLNEGIRCVVSGYRRGTADSFMSKGKINGQYVTSILAKRLALKSGFDEAILLDSEGMVAEGSGENLFIVKDGTIYTAPTSAAVLAGITRDTLIQLAREENYEVVERKFTVDQMYCADEVFMTGTAAEVTPVREIDHRRIGSGKAGEVTKKLQKRYFNVVKGTDDGHENWLTYI